jgi:signal transduction histidine kinase
MRLWPRSLAGRLAALLVLTLVIAQIATFVIFAGERVAAFRSAYREDLLVRLVSLIDLLEETPETLHQRLVATAGSPTLQLSLSSEPLVQDSDTSPAELRDRIAIASGRPVEDILVELRAPHWRERHSRPVDGAPGGRFGRRHGPGSWVTVSMQLLDGSWLNATAERPPPPPLGRAFLASFLISAAAVAAVGAFGVRLASAPLRRLAEAADRVGRGERPEPLEEAGPSETRRANIAFNRMRERLDRYVGDRTAMLAAIAHDLRTPITSLRLRAEFIEDEDVKAKILETLAEMQTMTEAVLTFARSDAEAEPTRPTDVTALVESVVEDAAESGRAAEFRGSPSVTVSCRPLALKRAVGNLVDNATSYGVKARIVVTRDAHEVRIVVEDEGPGIPSAELERVFEPFVRLETSRSRETGGAGLGLAIARSIFRSHGGDVRLENRSERGLRAMATLPL